MRTLRIAPAVLAVLLVAGCSDSGSGTTPTSTTPGSAGTGADATRTSGSDGTTATATATATTSDAGTGAGAVSSSQDVAVDELRDGTWQVGDAGEVEFTLQDGELTLVEVRPAPGWQDRISDEKRDEIEVHLTRDTTEWKFEVELETDTMEISKELEIKQAQGGTYEVGSAGEVTFSTEGTTLSLSDVRASSGWDITKRDESTDEIEIDFARSDNTGAKAQFQAEIDDSGIELEIDQKLAGLIPN